MNVAKRAIEIGEVGRNVAANIRRLREAQGISLRVLVQLMERPIPVSCLFKIEHCQRRVDVDDLAEFARVLKVQPADLLAKAPLCAACNSAPPLDFKCRTCGAES